MKKTDTLSLYYDLIEEWGDTKYGRDIGRVTEDGHPVELSSNTGMNFAPGKNIYFAISHESFRYREFYKLLDKSFPHEVHYIKPIINKRYDEKELRQLFKEFKELDIGIFITCAFLPRWFFHAGIDLIKIATDAGIRCFLVDNDPYEAAPWRPLFRPIMNNFKYRFSVWGQLNQYWDQLFGIENVLYTPILQDYSKKEFRGLNDNYEIVVISNLKIEKDFSSAAEQLVNHIGLEEFISNGFELFLGTRKHILDSEMPLKDKLEENSFLFKLYMTAFSGCKFYIINCIKNKKRLHIYGNKEWGNVFPDHYRGWLSQDDIEKMFNKGNILYLLPNISLSYLDAFGPLFDMVARNLPFLHPKPVRAEFNVDNIEFTDKENMNEFLNNAPDIWDNVDLEPIRQPLQSKVNQAIDLLSEGFTI